MEIPKEDTKPPVPLNLNNEVVRMRKEVRRVRTLVIRKLIKQIAHLKKKKGKEEDLERNRRRGARLLEEIHVMKRLKSDPVTKAALQKNLSFEFVCKNPKATITDRAIVRIATHPQFSKKIDTLKAAIKAFKDDRMTVLKGENETAGKKEPETEVKVKALPKDSEEKEGVDESDEKVEENKGEGDEEQYGILAESQSLMLNTDSPTENTDSPTENTDSPTENTDSPTENTDSPTENTDSPTENTDSPTENTDSPTENTDSPKENTDSPKENTDSPKENTDSLKEITDSLKENTDSPTENLASSHSKEMSETLKSLTDSVTPFMIEAPQIAPMKKMETEKPTAQKAAPLTQQLAKETPTPQKTQDLNPLKDSKPQREDFRNKEEAQENEEEEDVESDLESSDEDSDEKEYFDDSTEERFHKQSSQSEESDDDDFFLGKVSKLKNKKRRDTAAAPPGHEVGSSSVTGENPLLQPLDSLKPHQTEQDKLEDRLNSKATFTSVFCSSLSGSRGWGDGGRGSGRDGGRGSGRDGGRGSGRDGGRGSGRDGGRGSGRDGGRGLGRDGGRGSGRGGGRGSGRGRGREPCAFPSHQAPEQALHPSWEASKKRKEQLTQIVAFQGKKIKFDDDD
uniref:Serum response factor-binding protein 1 n=1 Tax=Esox lucius TaxID=8010 RepID=A0AAY5LB89_ESOLU